MPCHYDPHVPPKQTPDGFARIKLPASGAVAGEKNPFACDLYEHFIFHIRNSNVHLMELRIFEAIQSAAVNMGISNAFAAATLVDLGLRAPRKAFPASFLDYADKARAAGRSHETAPSLMALNDHWYVLRENFTFYTNTAHVA